MKARGGQADAPGPLPSPHLSDETRCGHLDTPRNRLSISSALPFASKGNGSKSWPDTNARLFTFDGRESLESGIMQCMFPKSYLQVKKKERIVGKDVFTPCHQTAKSDVCLPKRAMRV